MRPRLDSRARLRLLLGAVLLGLAAPAALLLLQASRQLDLEAFRGQQLLAEETVRRIDTSLVAAVTLEQNRPFDDYTFATALADGRVRRSPLSQRAAPVTLPGVLGHFQVDASGRLTIPLLPVEPTDLGALGIDESERDRRLALEQRIYDILNQNRLVREAPPATQRRIVDRAAELVDDARVGDDRLDVANSAADGPIDAAATPPESAPPRRRVAAERGQAAFDELSANRVLQSQRSSADLDASSSEQALAAAPDGASYPAAARAGPAAEEEVAALKATTPNAALERRETAAGASEPAIGLRSAARVSTFETELDPLQLARLDTGHLVLFRNAWRDGERAIQGMLIDRDALLRSAVTPALIAGGLTPGTQLLAAVGPLPPLELAPARAPSGQGSADRALYAARLSPPLAEIELVFRVGELPAGPAYRVLLWTAFALAAVLLGGLYAIYRFGIGQIALTRRHEDFVSAVSHELKTPLTSIRMYGEMLKSGWVSDAKRQTYYDFIFTEGERLSRLIDNVLQVARMSRGGLPITPETIGIEALLDMVRSKVASAVERAGFTLAVHVDPAVRATDVRVDPDAFVQIIINLIDNALKFAHDSERRDIELSVAPLGAGEVLICVRDYGPGVAPADMKRLFELFYRPDDERTRSIAGTGIGLALVRQLTTAMDGRVDVRNRQPGAEFRLVFPRAPSRSADG